MTETAADEIYKIDEHRFIREGTGNSIVNIPN